MAQNNVLHFPAAHRTPTAGRRIIASRLRDARKSKRMTQTELGERAGVKRQSISAYETGEKYPDTETFKLIVDALQQPLSFFTTEDLPVFGEQKPNFFRKCGPDSIRKNEACSTLGNWFIQTVKYCDAYVNYPAVDLIKATPKSSSERYSEDEIEEFAEACRQHWGLGLGPISNVLSLLEAKGIAICRHEMEGERIDTFSFWNGARPFIFMATDKESSTRNRFDLAHELGHLILHHWIESSELQDPKTLKLIEAEADRFAGAFLLPRRSFPNEVYTTKLDAFVELKKRWRASIQAMIYRCRDLDIIDDNQFTNIYKQISFRKWRAKEPLDNPELLPLEQPRLLKHAIELMLQGNRKHPNEILADLNFSPQLIAAFCNLPKDFFHAHDFKGDEINLK